MRDLRAFGVPLAGSLLAVTLAGCGAGPDEVVIAVALSSGDHAAVELAVEQINRAGGVAGARVRLTGLEWKFADSTAEESLRWAERLSSDPEVLALIGHADSATTLAAAPVYNQRRLPQLVTIASHPAITQIGPYTYRLCSSDVRQAQVLAHHAVRDLGARRIAVFFVNDDYGRGLTRLVRDEVRALGGDVVSSVMHRNLPQSEDMELIDSVLRRLKDEAPPDLFLLIQRIDAAWYTFRRIEELGFRTPVLGSDPVGDVGPLFQDSDLEGSLRVTAFMDPEPEDPRALAFRNAFRARTGGEEAGYSRAFAYDAVWLLHRALEEGGTSREGVVRYLERLSREGTQLRGVSGTYALNTDHDARRDMYVAEIDRCGARRVRVFSPDWKPETVAGSVEPPREAAQAGSFGSTPVSPP